ncbi:hypothetical protein OG764_01935 [Streptomyces sp. NBC_00239]|nr:AAA family ATPase [Streptomyces sp. NBC_00239]
MSDEPPLPRSLRAPTAPTATPPRAAASAAPSPATDAAARRQAPCVVFVDELDALGAERSRTHHSGLLSTTHDRDKA